MLRDLERRASELARRQYGLITRAQALALGFSPKMIEYRLKAGRWLMVHPGVYSIAGAPDGWHLTELAACFWCRGVAAGIAAGTLWRLRGCTQGRPEVLIKGSKTVPRAGIIVHHSTAVPTHHLTSVAGIPVTTVERTLFMFSGLRSEIEAAITLDDALRRKLTSIDLLNRYLKELSGRGRNGTGVMRRLLELRRGLAATPESPLETEFLQLVARSALPLPVPQYEVCDAHGFIARVDFAYPEAKLAIEIDSYEFHSSKEAWERDRERLSRLTSIGWRVEGITKAKMRNFPDKTIRRIAGLAGLE